MVRRAELERGRDFVIRHGASQELWASYTQFDYAVARQRVYGMVANVVLVVVFVACVSGWVFVITWLFTRPVTPRAASTNVGPPVHLPEWVSWIALGVGLGICLLILVAMFLISIRLALWAALLVAPFELAEEFLRTARRNLEKETETETSNLSTNFSNTFLSRWPRPSFLKPADMSWLRRAERALSFPLARGRRYLTSTARAVERRDRSRAIALIGWIELGLVRRGQAFRPDAIDWLGALEVMTVMQDWPIDLPSDDLSRARPPFATRLGRFILTVVTLMLAAIPVVAALAPGLIPSWR